MSVIAAITVPGSKETWIGSDTGSLWGNEEIYFGPKWFHHDAPHCALGMVGGTRVLTIIRGNMSRLFAGVSELGFGRGLYAFTENLRELYRDHGIEPHMVDGIPAYYSHGLLASPTSLHRILPDLSVMAVTPGHFVAEGSGSEFATGYVDGLCAHAEEGAVKAIDLLTGAIQCAINHATDCGGTISVDRVHKAEVPDC